MSKPTEKYVQKNMNKFLDTYITFKTVCIDRGFTTDEAVSLFSTYINRNNND